MESKAGKAPIESSIEDISTVLSMESKAEKAPVESSIEDNSTVLSMDTKAAKRESKTGKAMSMPVAKAAKKDADMSINQTGFISSPEEIAVVVDNKAGKTSLSMDSKAAKQILSMPAAKAAKKDADMSMKEIGAILSPVDSKAEKTSHSIDSKAEKQTLSMPAAKTAKKDVDMSMKEIGFVLPPEDETTDLSIGYGKAGKEKVHPRLFSTRKREPNRRRLSESLSYSMSMEVESSMKSTDVSVEYEDASDAAEAGSSAAAEEEIDSEMSTSLLAKASKTTATYDPMGKAVKGDHVLSLAPKVAKSTSKASKTTIMSVDAKAEKLEMMSINPKSGKGSSLSMSVGKAEKEIYKLFDNRRTHNHVRMQGVENR
jgi:hypothetical protein